MLATFSKISLTLSHIQFLLPLISLGLIFRPKIFLTPTLLLLFSMIFSAFLKPFFAIPYTPELIEKLGKNGFSFPSGHMQLCATFYGWFLIEYKNKIWLQSFILAALLAIGFALIFEGYHDIYDVLGGCFFASLTIFSYKAIFASLKNKNFSDEDLCFLIIFFAAAILALVLFFFYEIPAHLNIAFGAILLIGVWLLCAAKIRGLKKTK